MKQMECVGTAGPNECQGRPTAHSGQSHMLPKLNTRSCVLLAFLLTVKGAVSMSH